MKLEYHILINNKLWSSHLKSLEGASSFKWPTEYAKFLNEIIDALILAPANLRKS